MTGICLPDLTRYWNVSCCGQAGRLGLLVALGSTLLLAMSTNRSVAELVESVVLGLSDGQAVVVGTTGCGCPGDRWLWLSGGQAVVVEQTGCGGPGDRLRLSGRQAVLVG